MGDKIGFQFKCPAPKGKSKLVQSTHFASKPESIVNFEPILCLEDNEIHSASPKLQKQEVVIPLIESRNSILASLAKKRIAEKLKVPAAFEVSKADNENGDTVIDRALKAVLNEAQQFNDGFITVETKSNTFTIPAVSESDKSSSNPLGTALDEVEDADHKAMPIDGFGAALLRGMGWDGKLRNFNTTSKNIDLITGAVIRRPMGLGLGADLNPATSEPSTSSDPIRPVLGDAGSEELQMKPGSHCQITTGRKKDLYGIIESIDGDDGTVLLRMAISKETFRCLMLHIRLVTSSEYKEHAKYLNKAKADKVRAEQMTKLKLESMINPDDQEPQSPSHKKSKSKSSKEDRHESHSHSSRSEHKHREKEQKSRESSHKHKRSHHSEEKKHSKKRSHGDSSPSNHHKDSQKPLKALSWLFPQLRVRFIDKHYQKGRYYRQKLIIVDVPRPDHANCQTVDGRFLEDIPIEALETVVPPDASQVVMIVQGAHRSKLGHVVSKDMKRYNVLIQLSDSAEMIPLTFDDVCEYTNDASGQ